MQLTTFFPSVGLLLEIFFEDLLLSPSPEAILKALGGSLDGPHGYNTVTVAKKLIKRDILILSMGCGNAALQVAGLACLKAIELAGEGLKKSRRQQSMPFLPWLME